MHICIAIDAAIPARLYGGTERVVVWLGRALHELGHRVSFLARAGSRCDFAPVIVYDASRPIDAQIPADADIVHAHSEHMLPQGMPHCLTIHGNTREPHTFIANSIFVSRSHAAKHGATAFVHNGLDGRDYGPPLLDRQGERLAFLAKAAWKVKNVRGAIRVARRAGLPLDVLGGHRLNLKMGFRLTLDPNVRFHGMVGDTEKDAVLRQARGLLFPVLWPEPFGVAVIEAMYFGLPVFATPYGALPELVDQDSGWLSTEGPELAEAIRSRRYDKRAIHERWQAHFTHLNMARGYLEHYERILAGESLHPGPVRAPAVRPDKLLPWHN